HCSNSTVQNTRTQREELQMSVFLLFVRLFLFFYMYAMTMVSHMMKLLRIIAHFVLPASWLKSTRDIVQEALAKYNADRLGLADYALESVGGSVLCSSETYFAKSGAMYSVFGIPLWYHSSNPREVIQPDVQPGKCWAMDGTHGYVMIQLAMPIMVSAISLEHIPKEVAPSGRLDSAPKDFLIIGKERTTDSPDVVLGRFTYHIDREPIQVFDIKDPYCQMKSNGNDCPINSKVFFIITLKILNNHGNPDFTCIYRLRVHGQPINTVPMD
ncbi:unnamed protein product, partial [Candidula unifasciata]